MALILACISFLIVSATVSGQHVFYCNKTVQAIRGVSEGTIVTLMPGTQFYSNDLFCEWTIDAGTSNRVQLVMEEFDLEWSAKYATCTGYDNLQVLEGLSIESPVLTVLCHARNPYSIISRGQYLYLRFSSNNQNFYDRRGIRIKFHTFNNESCPPGWFQVSARSPDCLMMVQPGTAADWVTAQDNCNLNRANLASVLSQDELTSILEHGRNISGLMNAWIGLKHQQGSYKWIDQQKFNFIREVVGKSYNRDCVAQEFKSGDWRALECDTEHSYICKTKKDGSTVLYQSSPPSKPPEEENRGTNLYLLIIIVPVVLVCVIAVLFYCCYWRRRNERSYRNNKRNEAGPDETNTVSVALSPAQENSLHTASPTDGVMLYDPQMVAPPTYEEAQSHSVAPSNY